MIANTIVVGIDGSEGSKTALEWAIAEAETSERELLLVHAWDWKADAIGSPSALFGMDDTRTRGHSVLRKAAALARASHVAAKTRLVEGSASSCLLEASDGAAMLVVGTRGLSALHRTVLGSVSRACAQNATCPVVVVPRNRTVSTPPEN